MRRLTCALASTFVPVLLIACSDASRSAGPLEPAGNLSVALDRRSDGDGEKGDGRHVTILDRCDPASFNAVVGDGTCVRNGKGVTFADFIAELQRTRVARAWRFTPDELEARVGQTIFARNRGGETHTFTRVAKFGGGIVPELNQLSGNPVVARECTMLEADDFVAPGASYTTEKLDVAGDLNFQCCIHPWMRAVASVERR